MWRIDPPATPQRRVADPFGRPVFQNTPAGRAMAEAQRRNAFESMLQDRDQYTCGSPTDARGSLRSDLLAYE